VEVRVIRMNRDDKERLRSRRISDRSVSLEDTDGVYRDDRHYSSRNHGGSVEPTVGGHIGVTVDNMQSTFENMIAVIDKERTLSFTKDSVADMLKTVYEWLVIDPNTKITLPAVPQSGVQKSMWPEGSKIDTRRRRHDGDSKLNPRSLRDMGEDYDTVVASSVVSSTLEEDDMGVGIGTIIEDHSAAINHLFGEQRPPPPRRNNPIMAPVGNGRPTPRYSIVGGPVPIERVPETPEPSVTGPGLVEHKQGDRRRKPKVGVSGKAKGGDQSGGQPVMFTD